MRDDVKGFGIGILVGLVIGGVIGLLYAPKAGKELRRDIKDKAKTVTKDLKAKLNMASVDDIARK
jgi:gas vesicle protein